MASSSGVQQQQHFQQTGNPHHCKECGLYLNSAKSLEVHVQYHKENLLNKWATQAAGSHSEETNNNNTKTNTMKREFVQNTIAAAADSSDSMIKKSPEYGNSTTPETSVNFGHPPTPQSYHSASSPYQNTDNSAFSPGFQNYQSVKAERASRTNIFIRIIKTSPTTSFLIWKLLRPSLNQVIRTSIQCTSCLLKIRHSDIILINNKARTTVRKHKRKFLHQVLHIHRNPPHRQVLNNAISADMYASPQRSSSTI